MRRSDRRRTAVLALCAMAALAFACQAIVGLDRFSKVECTKDCDAGPDASDSGPDAADSGPGFEPSEASLAYRWAHWPMPNPKDAEVDANLAAYNANTTVPVDGGLDDATVVEGGLAVEIVVDGVTGLTWTKQSSPNQLSFAEASSYCAGIARATNWAFRLPTRIELVSILDYTQTPVPIDPDFGKASEGVFWTQSVALGPNPSSVWVVSFTTGGNADIRIASAKAYARCVQ